MGTIIRSPESRRDIAEIWWRIAQDNLDAADRIVDEFDRILLLIITQPNMGTARPEFGETVRFFPVGNYLLIYEPTHDGIELLRVVHGARDLPSAMNN